MGVGRKGINPVATLPWPELLPRLGRLGWGRAGVKELFSFRWFKEEILGLHVEVWMGSSRGCCFELL